jgi:hypothetical protein
MGPRATYRWGGEANTMARRGKYMMAALGLAILLVYMLMAALFNNLLYPLIIMLSIPQALVGGLLALLIAKVPLSIIAMIGVIMLMGLVSKNAILLVDYTNTLRSRGYRRDDALTEAGPTRLRPILMTTLAQVGGALPIALALGRGAEFRAPLGIVIIGGLLLSTMLTLLVIPCTTRSSTTSATSSAASSTAAGPMWSRCSPRIRRQPGAPKWSISLGCRPAAAASPPTFRSAGVSLFGPKPHGRGITRAWNPFPASTRPRADPRDAGYAGVADDLARLRNRGAIAFSPRLPDRAHAGLTGTITLGPESLEGDVVGLAETLVTSTTHLRRQNPLAKTLSFWKGVARRSPVMRDYERSRVFRPPLTSSVRWSGSAPEHVASAVAERGARRGSGSPPITACRGWTPD